MRIERCENGHFYDAEQFDTCPQCQAKYLLEGELPDELELFRTEALLGKGRTSNVFRIRPKERYAIKVVDIPDPVSESMAQNEYKIACMLKGEKAFLDYYAMYKHGNKVYFVQPEIRNLTDYIKQKHLHVLSVLSILEAATESLTLLNNRKIMHLDVKPSNIFVDDYANVKLGDFSVSCKVEEYQENPSRRGTPKYYSPEVYHRLGYSGKEDMYSLGITIYFILSGGKYPYDFGEAATCNPDSVYIDNPDFLEEINELIKKAVAYDPSDRFGDMKEMLTEFKKINQKIRKYCSPDLSRYLYPRPMDGPTALDLAEDTDTHLLDPAFVPVPYGQEKAVEYSASAPDLRTDAEMELPGMGTELPGMDTD